MKGLAILSLARMRSSPLYGEIAADERARLLKQMKAISHVVGARANKKAIAGKYFEIAKRFLGIEKEEKHG